MTTIQIRPEQLQQVSRLFEEKRQLVEQMISMLTGRIQFMEQSWDGTTKQQFYGNFQEARQRMERFVLLAGAISLELSRIAERFHMADLAAEGQMDPACMPPPPNSCAVPSSAPDHRNAFQKAGDSLVELGNDILMAADERSDKAFTSVGGFLDWLTMGIPKGMYQGYVERADKMFDSPNDFANGITFGVHGTIREAIFPTNAWSKEHMANIFGTAAFVTSVGGASSFFRPRDYFGREVKPGGATPTARETLDQVENPLKANHTEPSLPSGGKPKGSYTKGDSHGVKKENETADLLADRGYDIKMLDEVEGGNGYGIKETSNPDFLIEGKVFDCYSPTVDTNVDNIIRNIRTKTKTQAESIVLNLDGFPSVKVNEVTEGILRKANSNGDLKNLKELLMVKDGVITRVYGGAL